MGMTQSLDEATTTTDTRSAEILAVETAIEIGLEPENLVLSLLEQSDDCIKILTTEGNLEYMNCGGLVAMQFDDFDLIAGRKWWDLWPEGKQAMIRQMFERSARGTDIDFVAMCPTAKDEKRKWSVKLRAMRAGGGRIVGVMCTSRDVSETAATTA